MALSVLMYHIFFLWQEPETKEAPAEKKKTPTSDDEDWLWYSIVPKFVFHVCLISILFSNMCKDYWPQDDPNHWLYYEDSQAGQVHSAVVGLFVFSTSIT